jgi:hypothetical protein
MPTSASVETAGRIEVSRDAMSPAATLISARDDDLSVAGPEHDRAVVARLFGGLGNQMFQYAAGRSLALKTGSRLVLDAAGFSLPTVRRGYALDGYALAAEIRFDGYRRSPRLSTVQFPVPQRSGWIDRAARLLRARSIPVGRSAGENAFSVFNERSFDFDLRFRECGSQTYLVGYWQSERYFADVAGLVRQELTYQRPPDPANAQWLARIRAVNAVCVHVRRGDYLLPAHFKHHGLCSADYYRRSTALIRERLVDPQFFIFSDDWAWCREHLADADIVIVDANKPDAGQNELRLMAACRHHVSANSSLSWWGAWLAASEGQVVVAPSPWFSHRPRTPDLLPAGWVVMPRD